MRRCTEAIRGLLLGYRSQIEEHLHGTAVTLPQLRMLKAVQQQKEMSAASIARSCHITPQTLQSMLLRAKREGWIERGASQRNQRFVTANLTPAGEAMLQQGMQLVERVEEQIWSGISASALRVMRKTMEAGLANLDRREESVEESVRDNPSRL